MPPDLTAILIPHGRALLAPGGSGPVIRVLGRPPIIEGEDGEPGPPPAAEERAQRAFEGMGTILLLLIVLTAAWILIRRRL